MSVKIIINKAQNNAIKTGSIVFWDETEADLIPGDGKFRMEAIVVSGNSVYRNGRKLILYLNTPYASLQRNIGNRVPGGAQYERRYN